MSKIEFPAEIKKALNCIAEENRQKIALTLVDKPLAYTQLKKELGFTNGNFNHHLLELTKAGIINRYLGTDEPGPFEKYYKITDFGKDLLEGIFSSLAPSEKPREKVLVGTSNYSEILGIITTMAIPQIVAGGNRYPFGTARQENMVVVEQ